MIEQFKKVVLCPTRAIGRMNLLLHYGYKPTDCIRIITRDCHDQDLIKINLWNYIKRKIFNIKYKSTEDKIEDTITIRWCNRKNSPCCLWNEEKGDLEDGWD
jgi:hypothetical protein